MIGGPCKRGSRAHVIGASVIGAPGDRGLCDGAGVTGARTIEDFDWGPSDRVIL